MICFVTFRDDGDELEDELEGQLVKYEEDGGSEDQTASDMKDIESKHQMPLQDMKTQLLGSVSGLFVNCGINVCNRR